MAQLSLTPFFFNSIAGPPVCVPLEDKYYFLQHLIVLFPAIFFLSFSYISGEGDSTPLQYSCLENLMDGRAWWAAVHGVPKSQI